jgi:hypothetical protein
MTQTAIFGPVFATMLLTVLVWTYMFIRRISFLTNNDIGPEKLTIPGALAQVSPPGSS